MEILTNFGQQLRSLWNRGTLKYRIALVASVLGASLTIVGVGWWASRPQYMPLAKNLSPSEAAQVLEKLAEANIPYKKSFAASTIYVPERQWNDATLAIKDVVGEVGPQSDSLSSSLWDDPSTKRDRLVREKEQALAKTILRMTDVGSVNIHIAMPDTTPFVRDQNPAKASVMVGPRRGRVLAPEQAATIAATVASSVEGLSVEHVTVSDLEGRTIYPNSMSADGGLTHRYRYRRQIEADLAAKAETMLAEMLGPGRSIVRVNAEIDFTETERIAEQIDPKGVKIEEDITSIETSGGETTAEGSAGVASNLSGTGSRTTSPTTHKEETIKTVFAPGKTIDTIHEYGGLIKRLTISALVDLPSTDSQADSQTNPPVAGIAVQDVEELIKRAVGFDESRDDGITVLATSLNGATTGIVTMVDTLDRWDLYSNLVRNASLGIAAVVALVLGLLLIRKLRPMGVLAASTEGSQESRSAVLAELATQAQQNPEIVSKIVSAWLTTPSTIRMPEPTTSAATQRAA